MSSHAPRLQLPRGESGSTRRYLEFAVVMSALLLAGMQAAMISVALPDMISNLHAPLRWVGWAVTVFALAQAVAAPIAGKLSDELGRWRVFVGGMTLFTVSSFVCAVAPDVWVLIAARAFQGMAGGSLIPSAFGIVSDAFTEHRAQARGLVSSITPVGSLLGPNLGGVLVGTLGWRWTFAFNVPIGAAIVVAALALLLSRHDRGVERRRAQRIDVLGAVLLSVAMLGFIYALTEMSRRGIDPDLRIVAAGFALAVIAGVAFVSRELRVADPIVDLRLLRRRELSCASALGFLWSGCWSGYFPFLPLFATAAYGLSSAQTGVLLTPRAILTVVGSVVSSMLLPRTGYRWPIVAGLLLMVVGIGLTSTEPHARSLAGVHVSDIVLLASLASITGLGIGVAAGAVNNAGLDVAPERIAALAGMRSMFSAIGSTVFTAMVVLVTSSAPSTARGLERSFVGVSVISGLSMLLVLGIADRRRVVVAEPQERPIESGVRP